MNSENRQLEEPPLSREVSIRQTWFVTGAASCLGADIVRAALAAGHRVVATTVYPLSELPHMDGVAEDRLLALRLDEVNSDEVGVAVKAATKRFGGVDVLVHGAAACSPQVNFDVSLPPRDFSSSVRALFNITRGVLETMRKQRAGRIFHLVPVTSPDRGPTPFSITGFCHSVAEDVMPFGVLVSAVPAHEANRLMTVRA